MTLLGLPLLFASVALAHSGLKAIVVDGTTYPPFDSKIDHLIGPVRRIEWSHDIILTPYNPVTIESPAIACQPNAKPPALKATARAGADVTFNWSKIVRMHHGPIITYLGYLPTADTKPQDVKFFKIDEKGFDASKDKWANEIAAEHNNTYTIQLPSDIQSGTYVLRTELIALHGNMKGFYVPALNGPEFYPYCVNVDIIRGGSAKPKGVNFPGGYKLTDYGIAFDPYYGNGSGTEHNSKYALPGPPLYNGKFDQPTGQPPVVQQTGAYSGELEVQYKTLVNMLEIAENKVVDYVNDRWPSPNTFDHFFDTVLALNTERSALSREIDAFKKASQTTIVTAPFKFGTKNKTTVLVHRYNLPFFEVVRRFILYPIGAAAAGLGVAAFQGGWSCF